MKNKKISVNDQQLLKRNGISIDQANKQLLRFKRGFAFVELTRPCTTKLGILKLSNKEKEKAQKIFRQASKKKKIVKFVPASGAASRMFSFLIDGMSENEKKRKEFLKNLHKFAFYEELKTILRKQGENLELLRKKNKIELVAKALLEKKGLGYASAPKGMVRFHGKKNNVKTAFEEQLSESLLFSSNKKTAHIHFTLPSEARRDVKKHLKQAAKKTAGRYKFDLSDSIQSPATNSLAVDLKGNIVRDEKGELLLRPAGHGALLKNLNQIKADIIYVKNIDNILPKKKRRVADEWKKILVGLFYELQEEVFEAQKALKQKKINPKQALRVLQLANALGWRGKGRKSLKDFFNRPMRIGGVVANTGEPGGGPFWIKSGEGESAQIVESAEVKMSSRKQKQIWMRSTHFNPVEFVCGVCDHQGKKYNLMKFKDDERGIITRKNYRGKTIQAMELPGLWNGSMGNWLTVFVEIPGSVFAPVKTVLDLLRIEHQTS